MNQPIETVKQEAARRGVSLSEVRRQRNEATPRKETLRLADGMFYLDGFGERVKVRLMGATECTPVGTKHIFICDETFRRYTEHGIYDGINGPLAKFNLAEHVVA